MASKRIRVLGILFCLAWAGSLISCGGDAPPVVVTLNPINATVDQGATQQFGATVTGSNNTQVAWSVQEGEAGGSITAAGLYTAPANAGTFHIVATSQADRSKSATATVAVNAVTVTVSPTGSGMDQGFQVSFSATVQGTVINTVVTWSVQEGQAGGSITPDGVYTAPAAAGTFHVVATSQADPTKNATAAVSVNDVSVSVSPVLSGVRRQGTRQLSGASVRGTVDTRVAWTVEEGVVGGSISPDGVYTAPDAQGTFHLIATSVWDPSKSARAAIEVVDRGFSLVGEMTIPRQGHTATLLLNGLVLVAGGVDIGQPGCHPETGLCGVFLVTASAELFDPATSTFRPTGNMSSARSGHTATLLADGKVLIAGGQQDDTLADSCPDTSCSLATAELYDPATETFTPTGSMTMARQIHTATPLADGRVLVIGDDLASGVSGEIYDPATGQFTATANTASSRRSHTATLLPDGRVLVAGGHDTPGCFSSNSAEIFDPATGTFSPTGSMAQARSAHSAVLLADGRVLLSGGETLFQCDIEQRADAEVFDPATGTFGGPLNLIVVRSAHAAMLLPGGEVLLAGSASAAELFDPAVSQFVITGGMVRGRSGHTATLLPDGRVLVTGGLSFDKSAEVYQ